LKILKIYSLSKSQVQNALILTIVPMLYLDIQNIFISVLKAYTL
jgi:hypothetical protein